MKYLRKKARFFDKFLKAKTHLFLLIGLLVLFSFLPTISPPIPVAANITDGMTASNVLGQSVAGVINYTQGGINNGWDGKDGFYQPSQMAIDTTNHRLFVSDTENNRVLVFNLNSSDVLVDYTADYVLGQANFTTFAAINQNLTQSGLNKPEGLAYDSVNNRLFVADHNNNRIMVFDVTAITNGENAVNVLGQTLYTTRTSATTQSGLYRPHGLIHDSANNRLFVADADNNRVMVFDVTTTTIANGENAANVLGQGDFTSNSGATTQSGLRNPYGLAYDSVGKRLFVGNIYPDSRVLVFDVLAITNGENAINVLGPSNFTTSGSGADQAQVGQPHGLDYDSVNNRLFVADYSNSRVMVFDVTAITNGENAVNVLGQQYFTGNSAGTTQSGLYFPTGVSYNPTSSQLFVADGGYGGNNRIMIFNAAIGTLIPDNAGANGANAVDVLGQSNNGVAVYTERGANNSSNSMGFYNPRYTAIDTANHRLFVTDSSNNRVLVFNLDASNNLIDYTADYVLGQDNFTNNGYALSGGEMGSPAGLAYDSANNRLFVFDAGNNRVLVFDAASITNGESAINVLGQPSLGSNNPTATQAGLYSNSKASGLILDSANSRLFVADSSNNRVMVFDVASITDGENAINVLGQTNFTSNGSATTQIGLSSPTGLTYDSTRKYLFVGDSANYRVMVFDVAAITDGEPAINVLGQTNFTNNSSANTNQSGLRSPMGLFYDSARSRLFVADGNGGSGSNNRIVVFDLTTIADGESAVNVLGQLNFTSGNSATTQSGLYNPVGVDYNASTGTVYIADSGNNRVMAFTINIPPVATAPSSISQATDGTGYVTFQTTISDADSDNTKLKVEFSHDGATWPVADIYSVTPSSGTVDFDDAQTYQIGSVNPIDTSTGPITLTIVWNTKGPNNGEDISAVDLPEVVVLITTNDGFVDSTAQNEIFFSLYNAAPSGLTALTSPSQTTSAVTLNWTAVTEVNFDHYEVWYGTTQAHVQNRNLTAVEWDNSDDANLAVKTNTSTIITGLNPGTADYFKIWAVDAYGNIETVSDIQVSTSSPGGSNVAIDPPPAAPTNIQSTATSSQIVLTWIDPGDNDLAGIEIWRNDCLGGAISQMLLTIGPGVKTYTDANNIQPNTTCLYMLVAKDNNNSRTASQEVSVVVPAVVIQPTTVCGNGICETGESCAVDCPTITPVITLSLTAQVLSNNTIASSATPSLALALAASVLIFGAFLIHVHTGEDKGPIGFFSIFPLLFTSSSNSYMYLRKCGPNGCKGPHFARHKVLKHFARASLAATVIAGVIKLALLVAVASFLPGSQGIKAETMQAKVGETIRATLTATTNSTVTNVLLAMPTPNGTTIKSISFNNTPSSADPNIGIPIASLTSSQPAVVIADYQVAAPGVISFKATATSAETSATVFESSAVAFSVPTPVLVDATPPNTTIDRTPQNSTNARAMTFFFSSSESGSTFTCSLDDGAYVACASPHTVAGLSIGSHTFMVKAIDASQNVDPTPATHTWTITAPVEPPPPVTIEEPAPVVEELPPIQEPTQQPTVVPAPAPASVQEAPRGSSSQSLTKQELADLTQDFEKNLPKELKNAAQEGISAGNINVNFNLGELSSSSLSSFTSRGVVPVVLNVQVVIPRKSVLIRIIVESEPQVFTYTPTQGVEEYVIPVDLVIGQHKATLQSIDTDGTTTQLFSVVFPVNLPACFDGLDNDNDGLMDENDPGCSSRDDNDEFQAPAQIISLIASESVTKAIEKATTAVIQTKTYQVLDKQVLNNPKVEQATTNVASPIVVVAAAANVGTAVNFASLLVYLQGFMTQPLLLFTRRKRKQWGLVYSSLTKLPVDLALVRLFDSGNGKLIQTRVTDKLGRYLFLANPGSYAIKVQKPGFTFPSDLLKDKNADIDFTDIYHGNPIQISAQSSTIAKVIPVDPLEKSETPREVIRQRRKRSIQKGVAWTGPLFAMASVVINPTLTTTALLIFQFGLLGLFKRLSIGKQPKSWGSVIDKSNGQPLSFAVARIFDSRFNKLLETQITDKNGRYAFLVGKGSFYITVEKQGYAQYKSAILDLSREGLSDIVKQDIGLRKGEAVMAPVVSSESTHSIGAPAVKGASEADKPINSKKRNGNGHA